jgi:hypothetical protein
MKGIKRLGIERLGEKKEKGKTRGKKGKVKILGKTRERGRLGED